MPSPDHRVPGPDHRLLAVLRRCGAHPGAAGAARALSLAGEHGALWMAAGLAGASRDPARRRAWLRATALVVTAHAVSVGVKRAVRRPRPHLPGAPPLVRTAGRHGFPSSHAASSAAAALAFGALLPRAPLRPLAAAVCLSRLIAGVHYPSDVACGALLGAAIARLGRNWSLSGPRRGNSRTVWLARALARGVLATVIARAGGVSRARSAGGARGNGVGRAWFARGVRPGGVGRTWSARVTGRPVVVRSVVVGSVGGARGRWTVRGSGR